jgi:hypothetical protein
MLGEPNLLAEVAVAVHQASKPILSLDVSDTPVLLVAWRILAHLGPIFFGGLILISKSFQSLVPMWVAEMIRSKHGWIHHGWPMTHRNSSWSIDPILDCTVSRVVFGGQGIANLKDQTYLNSSMNFPGALNRSVPVSSYILPSGKLT